MKKKVIGFLISFIAILIGCMALMYCLVSLRYTEGFTYNTRINGIYCTGMSVEAVNSELIKSNNDLELQIFFDGQNTDVISLADIDYSLDYTDSLVDMFMNQNPWRWPELLFSSRTDYSIDPVISYSENKLKALIGNLSLVKDYDEKLSQKVSIVFKDDEYKLDEELHKTISEEIVYELCKDAVYSDLVVEVSDIYFSEPIFTDEMLKTKELAAILTDYQRTKIVYDMGDEQVPIDSKILVTFLSYDENGQFMFDENGELLVSQEKIEAFVDNLCDQYDTYGLQRDYITFRGEVKHFSDSNNYYGTLLNREEEKKYLVQAIKNKTEEVHIPMYKKEPYHRGLNDIGDEFIEIDLTNQVMYYIKNREMIFTSDVVTGKPSQGTPTPEMVCSVYKKNTDTYLKGTDYYNHVDYWIAIYKKIGLHDASWQRSFGGTRYLKHGSHGCINMPKKKVSELYDLVSLGLPVIVYK